MNLPFFLFYEKMSDNKTENKNIYEKDLEYVLRNTILKFIRDNVNDIESCNKFRQDLKKFKFDTEFYTNNALGTAALKSNGDKDTNWRNIVGDCINTAWFLLPAVCDKGNKDDILYAVNFLKEVITDEGILDEAVKSTNAESVEYVRSLLSQ